MIIERSPASETVKADLGVMFASAGMAAMISLAEGYRDAALIEAGQEKIHGLNPDDPPKLAKAAELKFAEARRYSDFLDRLKEFRSQQHQIVIIKQ